MRAIIVPASGWFNTPSLTDAELKALLLCGILPVNDKMEPLFEGNEKITLLYGGRGGGKSEAVADRWIDDCRNEEYFKGYFGRKVFEDVRGSCFATLVHSIKKRGLEKEFHFSEADTSTMMIRHKATGNRMIPFGADKADRLKSIKDPTDVWCEELDQFTAKDIEAILPTLRTTRGHNRFYGSFNTEPVRKTHWIIRTFFPEIYTGTEELNTAILEGISVKKIFINFPDNYFIDREAYGKMMLLSAGGDWGKYNAIAAGEWGSEQVGNPFWKYFVPAKHVADIAYTAAPVHLSVDENRNPYLTMAFWQIAGKMLNQFHEIPSKSPDNNAVKAAGKAIEYLHRIRHSDIIYLYGDTTSQKGSTTDEESRSFFELFQKTLQNAGFRVVYRVGKGNPLVAMSASFINEIFQHGYDGYQIRIGRACTTSIDDYQVVKEGPNGEMLKPKIRIKNADGTFTSYEPNGHFSDALRYFVTQLLKEQYDKYRNKKKSGTGWASAFA